MNCIVLSDKPQFEEFELKFISIQKQHLLCKRFYHFYALNFACCLSGGGKDPALFCRFLKWHCSNQLTFAVRGYAFWPNSPSMMIHASNFRAIDAMEYSPVIDDDNLMDIVCWASHVH